MPKLIRTSARSAIAVVPIVLLSLSLPGCVQSVVVAQNQPVQYVDCRSCHGPNGVDGAKDFSAIYANPTAHHPVGVSYPLGANAFPNFSPPDAQVGDIAFFDKNGNGKPDVDEIQLFGTSLRVTVECASCHRPHGNFPKVETKRNSYLRFDNAGSALCQTCHRR